MAVSTSRGVALVRMAIQLLHVRCPTMSAVINAISSGIVHPLLRGGTEYYELRASGGYLSLKFRATRCGSSRSEIARSYNRKLWMKRKGDVPFWGCWKGQPQ